MIRIIAFVAALLAAGCSATTLLNVASRGSGVGVERGVSYGQGPRARYDVYRPAEPRGDAPVVVFVYGGSWDSGDRGMYAFVGNTLAKAGFVVAIPDYRVFPDALFPGFVEDTARAVATISGAVAGGRPVFLAGHSAGAQIAALVALDPRYLGGHGRDPCDTVAGFVGLAGPYDFLPLTSPRYKEIFPEATRPASQPVNFAGGRHPPALLLHGEEDNIVEPEDSIVMAAALRRAGNRASVKLYPGVGHADLIGTFSTLLEGRAPALADTVSFIRAEAARNRRSC